MVVVAICGTPGSGKSALVSLLCKKLGSDVRAINVSELVLKEKLYEEYDDALSSCIMSTKLVKRRLALLLKEKEGSITLVETHTPSVLPKRAVDFCVVLQCDTAVIYDRLTERGYSERKRAENVEAEIMQVVLEEAIECLGRRRVSCVQNNASHDLDLCLKQVKKLITKHS